MLVRKREAAEIIDGIACRHGHGTRRYARFGGCVECVRLANLRAVVENKETRRRASREWRRKNRSYSNALHAEYAHQNPERNLLIAAKSSARRQGLPFGLTIDDIAIPELCPVLGIKLRKGRGRRSSNSPSIDRIIPERGYVKGNVVVVSWRANKIKNDASVSELEMIAAFYRRLVG